jgi:hypothetical protein
MATSILDEARQGDWASVVVMGSPASVLVGEASPYLVSVAEEIDALTPQDGAARIDQILDPISQILTNSPASRKEIYLITDMQRSTWLGDNSPSDVTELRRRLLELADQARFTILDTGGQESPNLAVTQIAQIDPLAMQGRPTLLRAGVTYFGKVERPDVRVELRRDDDVEAAQTITLAPGETKFVTFSPTLNSPGDVPLEVRVAGDALAADNARHLVARVRESLNVLLIDGEPSGERFRSETDYLRVALAPARDDGAPDFIRVDTRLESDIQEQNLDGWDIIVLANVGQLTEAEAHSLDSFVRRGGGLAVYLGSQTDVEAYNRVLFADGKGLLPAQLLETVGNPTESAAHFSFDPRGYQHPLVADFRENEQAGLVNARCFRYIKARVPDASPAVVALAFDTGDPAVIVSAVGQGQVALLTTSADLDWNTWAVSPSFVPVMQRLAELLAAGKVRREEVNVGQVIALALPDGASELEATLTTPTPRTLANKPAAGRPVESIKADRRNSSSYLSYAATDRVGVYSFGLGPPVDQTWRVPVNTVPIESDLAKIEESELHGTLAGWTFRLLDRPEAEETNGNVTAADNGSIHYGILLVALVLAAFIEPALACWFGHNR